MPSGLWIDRSGTGYVGCTSIVAPSKSCTSSGVYAPTMTPGNTVRIPSLITLARSIWRGYFCHEPAFQPSLVHCNRKPLSVLNNCACSALSISQSIVAVPPDKWLNSAETTVSDNLSHLTLPLDC